MQSGINKPIPKLTHQCKAVATIAVDDVPRLTTLLEGFSGQAGLAVLLHVHFLTGPVKDKVAAQLRLTHYLPSQNGAEGLEAADRCFDTRDLSRCILVSS